MTPEDLWLLREVVGMEQSLQLASIRQPLALRDVYGKVDFRMG